MRPLLILVAVVIATSLGACASNGESRAEEQPPDQPRTDLVITFRSGPTAAPEVWQLSCDPGGGSHPGAAKACRHLDAAADSGEDLFAPPPKDMLCTQIYGGPQQATVQGTFRGKVVDASYSRSDGCEIQRWDRMAPVIDPPR